MCFFTQYRAKTKKSERTFVKYPLGAIASYWRGAGEFRSAISTPTSRIFNRFSLKIYISIILLDSVKFEWLFKYFKPCQNHYFLMPNNA